MILPDRWSWHIHLSFSFCGNCSMDRLDRFSDSGVDCLDIAGRIGEHLFIIKGFHLERLTIDVILVFFNGH